MKQQGPTQKPQARSQKPAVRGPEQAAPSVDRSMLGRRYETGQALRGRGSASQETAAQQPASEMDRVAGALHERHGEQIQDGSAKVGVPAEATAAIVLTETSQLRGVSDDRVPVRFEPYEFFRRTGKWLVATHRDQDAEHQVFDQAKALDPAAAHESLRMGVAQLSGQEAAAAGHESAAAMYAAMHDGEQAQIDGLLSVVGHDESLRSAMGEGDWRAVAELRAGPGYGALGYDDALAAYAGAYKRATVGYGGGDDGDDDKPKKKKKSRKKP